MVLERTNDMTKSVLHAQMLGGFSLQLGSEALPPLPSRNAASLLAFLILHRDRAQTRDLLAGRFWSDIAEDKARRRLSNTLWQIRSALGRDGGLELLDANSQTIQLHTELEIVVDVETFQRRLDEFERRYQTDRRSVGIGDLTAIVESYRGELLSGHYDEWIYDPRRRIRDRYLAAVVQLVQMNTGEADYETALRHARTLISVEPLAEEWHREVIRLYAMNGQPSAAERHYDEYRSALQEELNGAVPDLETEQLVERIRRDSVIIPPVLTSPDDVGSPFLGRSSERSALLGRVNELVNGKGGVVLVEGDPGMGKSRLMEELISGAEWRSAQVLVGSHTPTSVLSPYSGLKAALEPATTGLRGERLATHLAPIWLRQASTVLEPLQELVDPNGGHALRPEEEPWRTTEALAQVVLAQAKPKPTVLVLEDIHWCDEDSMQVLVQLGDRLIDSGVLVCLSYQRLEAQRSEVIWRGLGELEAKPGSSRVVVGPLAEDEVRQLVASELGAGRMSEPALRQLNRTSGGNPYIILEILRSAIDVMDEEALVKGGADGEILPWLTDLLSQRIESAPETVRLVLEALAALGVPASSLVLAAAAGLSREVTIHALAEAVDAGFVLESTKGCEFTQEQSRLAVYGGIGPERRIGLHGRIVDALIAHSGGRAEELAHHAWQAGQWQRAYQYHSLAAEAALRVNAYQTTAEHFGKADDAALAAGLEDTNRTEDLFDYERVLDILGRRDKQQELLDRLAALDDVDPTVRRLTSQRHGWMLAHTDRGAEAAALALNAIETSRRDGHNVGELLTIVGCARAWSGDLSAAIEPLEQAVEELIGGGLSTVSAELMLGRTLGDLFRPDKARHHLENAYDQAKAANDARSQVEALGHLATLHHSQQNEAKAESAFLEALTLARDIGYRHGEGSNLLNLATFYAMLGRGGMALPLIDQALEVFASLASGRGEAFVKGIGSELAHWLLGDDVRARSDAEDAAVFFRSVGDVRHEAMCLVTLASIDRRQGRRVMANRRLIGAIDKARSSDDPSTEAQIQIHLAMVDLDLERLDDAQVDIDAAETLVREHELPMYAAVTSALEAKLMAARGYLDEAVDLANRAISLNRPSGYRPHLVAWWCSEILSAAGEQVGAGEQVALAYQLVSRNLEEVPASIAASSWDGIAEHRSIAEARELHFVDQIEWRVPRVDAPTGRTLDTSEYVDVVWTTSHPDDWEWTAAARRRQHRILRLTTQAASRRGVARVSDLAEVLGVSERTIKRDLAQLRADGHTLKMRRGEEKS